MVNFFGADGFHNMFVFQPTFSTINLKQGNNERKFSSWQSKGVYDSNPFLLHNL